MIPVARLGDTTSATSSILTGSGNVFVENLPIAVLGAALSPTQAAHGPSIITVGSGLVFANNIPILRISDLGPPHIHPTGIVSPVIPVILVGSGLVFSG